MQTFISELRRRNVLRVAAFYAAAGWLLVQVATQVFPFFDIGNGVVRVVVIAIVIGFPAVLAFSWFYEFTPQGLKLESQIEPGDTESHTSGGKLDRWIIAILLLAVVLLLSDKLVPRKAAVAVPGAPGAGAGPGAAAEAPMTAHDRSIAVLPFANLSDQKENAYFAQGMQDEILTRLARIGALKVISRTSTQHYASSPDNLPEIARQLGVANILEGSVQRAGDKVHVTVQLIRAATDEHLWADSYDRKLDDVFGVEGEVAQAIATALQAELSGGEQAAMVTKPTTNAAAYQAYLRGLGDEMRAFNAFAPEPVRQAESEYAEAVKLDPGFALAWAHLSIIKSYIYFNRFDRSVEILAQAKDAADTALRLHPEMGEGYLALGYYHYRGLRDFDGGLQAFAEALKRLPNNADVLAAIGYIERRQGKWQESTAHLEQATALDPRNTGMLVGLALNYSSLRQHQQALDVYDRALIVTPHDADILAAKAQVYIRLGDLDAAGKLLDTLPTDPANPGVFFTRMQYQLERRQFDQVIAMLADAGPRVDSSIGQSQPNMYMLLGLVQHDFGRREAAREPCLRALEQLNALRKSDADDMELGTTYAGVYACLGDNAKAVRVAQRTVELNAGDALGKGDADFTLALALVGAGDKGAALAVIERLLTEPTGQTKASMRLNPFWDPIRDDPRFQKLIAE